MKKINGLVLSTLTAAFLVGCGGGGGSSSSTPTVTTTDITVERGAIWGATVTDATGKSAVQKVGDSNIYTFDTAITYPVKSVGGIIDIDGDSTTTDDIFDFTGKELISYTNVITPITNYLGDITTESGKAKLAKLESLGLTKDDLVNTVASKSTTKKAEMISLTNALFELMNDSDTNNDDLTNEANYTSFKNRFDTFVNMVKDDVAINAKASSQALEETVLKGVLNNYTEAEGKSKIEQIKGASFTLTSDMLSGKTYKLNPNDDASYVVFKLNADGTSSEIGYLENGSVEYTEDNATWSIVDGKLQITLSDKSVDTYTFATTPANGVKVTVKTSDESFSAVVEEFADISNSSTSTPTEQPTTTSFISGKSITALLGDGVSFTANFYADHSYYDTTPNDGDCSGTWNDIGNNTITTSCGSFSFPSSNLSVGVNFTLDGDQSAPESAKITTISDTAK